MKWLSVTLTRCCTRSPALSRVSEYTNVRAHTFAVLLMVRKRYSAVVVVVDGDDYVHREVLGHPLKNVVYDANLAKVAFARTPPNMIIDYSLSLSLSPTPLPPP